MNPLIALRNQVVQTGPFCSNETATTHATTVPFLGVFGWTPSRPLEMVLEYIPPLAGGVEGQVRLDIACYRAGDDKPSVGVEVKHWGMNLQPHRKQLFNYLAMAQIPLGILTNGYEFEFWYRAATDGTFHDLLTFSLITSDESLGALWETLTRLGFGAAVSQTQFETKLGTYRALNEGIEELVRGLRCDPSAKAFRDLISRNRPEMEESDVDYIVQRALIQVYGSRWVQSFQEDTMNTTEDEIEFFLQVKSVVGAFAPHLPQEEILWQDTVSYFSVLFRKKWFVRYYGNGAKRYFLFPKDIYITSEGLLLPYRVTDAGVRVDITHIAQIWALAPWILQALAL